MSKKNLPNIPIYIGDWEKDCNVLSLESEGAWLRIIFKLWTKGKQNSIKIPTKSLQNLWRCSGEKMQEIINDLIFNEICEIKKTQGFVEFTCRRFVKENKISKVRSEASKSKKTKTKPKQNANKPPIKSEQNTDYDNENEIDNVNNYEVDSETFLKIEKLKIEIENEFSWRESIIRNYREVKQDFDEAMFGNYLEQFFKIIENDGEDYKTIRDTKKHFNRWLKIEITKSDDTDNKKNNGASPEFRRTTLERIAGVRPKQ